MRRLLREIRWHFTLRCDYCNLRFRWKRDPRHTYGDKRVFHGPCMGYLSWRSKADERLDVIAVMCDLSGLTGRDVQSVFELRTETKVHGSNAWNAAWRVFYDLGNRVPESPDLSTGEKP